MTKPSKRPRVGSHGGTPWSILVLLLLTVLLDGHSAAAQQAPAASPTISFETPDGQVVCNAGGSSSQIPGQTNMFVGGGYGPGSLDYCHNPGPARQGSFLGLFRMDWANHKMILVNYLFRPQKPPVREPAGVWSAYDPYATSYNGRIWVAFECAVPGNVSTCIAPMTPDSQGLDLSRLTVAVQGSAQKSASTPVLLNFQNGLYLYWVIDSNAHQLPSFTMITRGMQLQQDAQGRMWGAESGGHAVATDDPRLTMLVDDVNPADTTANHVAQLRSAIVAGSKILAITTLGGTAQQVCVSAHENSPGCFRMSLSIAAAPLGQNVFGRKVVSVPSLPNNVVSYPRIFVDPSGHRMLIGAFFPPKVPDPRNKQPQVPTGVRYIPFDPIMAAALRSP